MNPDCALLLQAASFRPQSLQAPSAWIGHLPFAWWLVQAHRPRVLVELGTHSGNSYFAFCQAVKHAGLDTRCHAVDTWRGDEHAGAYSEEVYRRVNETNTTHYAGFSSLLRMTFDEALDRFPDGSVDLLHIDGLHSYDAVRHDFETWLPKLADNAIVLFHDTNVHERDFGVWKLWEELRPRYPLGFAFEHSHGLGVLQVGQGPNSPIFRLIAAQPQGQTTSLQTYFKSLGDAQVDRFHLSLADERLQAEKDNAQAQILYRDDLVRDLRNLLQAEKDNAHAQIVYRDDLVRQLQAQLEGAPPSSFLARLRRAWAQRASR